MEVIARTRDGAYTGITAADLIAEEEALTNTALGEPATTPDSFVVGVSSSTGTAFTISRSASGALTFDCSLHGRGGCPEDGDWGN
jgi:hypothetical protein